jgi:hypothetical protein
VEAQNQNLDEGIKCLNARVVVDPNAVVKEVINPNANAQQNANVNVIKKS